MKLRLVLADDHRMLREALVGMLARDPDFEIVGQAATAREALEQVAALRPDVLVLDLGLPDMTGIEVARRLNDSGTKVVVLSGYTDKRFVQEALKAGAVGYVSKSAAGGELAQALRVVMRQQTYLSPEVASSLAQDFRSRDSGEPPPSSVLAPREREVLALIAVGARSAQIAARLNIKVGTVEAHRRNITRKLGIRSVAELTKYALREGLTSSSF